MRLELGYTPAYNSEMSKIKEAIDINDSDAFNLNMRIDQLENTIKDLKEQLTQKKYLCVIYLNADHYDQEQVETIRKSLRDEVTSKLEYAYIDWILLPIYGDAETRIECVNARVLDKSEQITLEDCLNKVRSRYNLALKSLPVTIPQAELEEIFKV